MFKFIMTSIVNHQQLHDEWLNNYISPGNIGSVGDALMNVRLKQSAPDMSMRYDKFTHGNNEIRLGSNVQDGMMPNYFGSIFGRTIDHNWNIGRKKRYKIGMKFENQQPPDKTPSMQVYQGGTPKYSWLNTTSNVYRALHTGSMFLPAPGEYRPDPNTVPRGGNIPSIVGEATQPNTPVASTLKWGQGSGEPIFGGTLFSPMGTVAETLK